MVDYHIYFGKSVLKQPVNCLHNPITEYRWRCYEEIFTGCAFMEYGTDRLPAHHYPGGWTFRRQPYFGFLRRVYCAWRFSGNDLSLVFLDLDKFKQINDQHGHDVGDDALVYVADTLQDIVH